MVLCDSKTIHKLSCGLISPRSEAGLLVSPADALQRKHARHKLDAKRKAALVQAGKLSELEEAFLEEHPEMRVRMEEKKMEEEARQEAVEARLREVTRVEEEVMDRELSHTLKNEEERELEEKRAIQNDAFQMLKWTFETWTEEVLSMLLHNWRMKNMQDAGIFCDMPAPEDEGDANNQEEDIGEMTVKSSNAPAQESDGGGGSAAAMHRQYAQDVESRNRAQSDDELKMKLEGASENSIL